MVTGVHGITVGSENTKTVKTKFGPLLMNVEPKSPGKIVRQEEVMVSLAEADPDSLLFQGNDPIHDWPETGIDDIIFAEPEIKKITRNDQLIQSKRSVIVLNTAASISASKPIKKVHKPFIVGAFRIFEVNVGEKDRFHAVTLSGGMSPRKE
jgi:hypothetical protein